jgi:8-oxo-dGTP pyrophosphatase MutT (NUDIX family)
MSETKYYCEVCGNKNSDHKPADCPTAGRITKCKNACVYIIDGKGNVILHRRAKDIGGQFASPGGRIEKNESPRDAAIREAKEEGGFILDPANCISVCCVNIPENLYVFVYKCQNINYIPATHGDEIDLDEDFSCFNGAKIIGNTGHAWVNIEDALKNEELLGASAECLRVIYERF